MLFAVYKEFFSKVVIFTLDYVSIYCIKIINNYQLLNSILEMYSFFSFLILNKIPNF